MTSDPILSRLGPSTMRRFFAKIRQNFDDPIYPDCWIWTGSAPADGYPQFWMGPGRRTFYAHRVIWSVLFGPIPSGIEIHHKCENRRCVNPLHLQAVTESEHKAIDNGNRHFEEVRPTAHAIGCNALMPRFTIAKPRKGGSYATP